MHGGFSRFGGRLTRANRLPARIAAACPDPCLKSDMPLRFARKPSLPPTRIGLMKTTFRGGRSLASAQTPPLACQLLLGGTR
jgi:hypothetical protein